MEKENSYKDAAQHYEQVFEIYSHMYNITYKQVA